MIVERSTDTGWLSNSYLVADRAGGHAVLIDTGAPPEPLLAAIAARGLAVTHVLCTHHHPDHVQHNATYRARFGCPIGGHPSERALFPALDLALEDGDTLAAGALQIRVLHVPGHTVGQLAFVVDEERVFTGDTLFRRSVGGTIGPGHGTFGELRHSILDVLFRLRPATLVSPGHGDETTIAAERERNPFVRAWLGADPLIEQRCTAVGEPATLLLRARDYDDGTKCWVRFDRGGREDIVPGSRVAPLS